MICLSKNLNGSLKKKQKKNCFVGNSYSEDENERKQAISK